MRTPIPIPTRDVAPPRRPSIRSFLALLHWIDGSRLIVEPYRQEIMTRFIDATLPDGRVAFNEGLASRAKKNFKSTDAVLMCLYKLLGYDAVGGNDVFLLANDQQQASDDLSLAKKIIESTPVLRGHVTPREHAIERKDGRGALTVLPAMDVVGLHGKSYVFCVFDEIWGYRSWDVIEGLELDPTRPDAQRLFTSYNTLFSKKGIPLHDLIERGKSGNDPRFFFSFYSADYTTDPGAADLAPVERANPSRGAWSDPDYLQQQQRRLPPGRFRRLHLNLGGQPEGAAVDAEALADCIQRGVRERAPEPARRYYGYLDMSSGQQDDSAVAFAYKENGKAYLALARTQAQRRTPARPTFDPYSAITEFAALCHQYAVRLPVGDGFARGMFLTAFAKHNLDLQLVGCTTSDLYEKLQVHLNAREVVLLDHPELESQLLSLVWKGGKITHPANEHDDLACAVAGALVLAMEDAAVEVDYAMTDAEANALRMMGRYPAEFWGFPEDEIGGSIFDKF